MASRALSNPSRLKIFYASLRSCALDLNPHLDQTKKSLHACLEAYSNPSHNLSYHPQNLQATFSSHPFTFEICLSPRYLHVGLISQIVGLNPYQVHLICHSNYINESCKQCSIHSHPQLRKP